MRAVITNMHADLDYEVLRQSLPDGVVPAHDGMRCNKYKGWYRRQDPSWMPASHFRGLAFALGAR
jgi:hypothetical protein